MCGYDKAKFVEAFGISEQLVPVMLIAIGKATKPGHSTTRLPIEDVAFFKECQQNRKYAIRTALWFLV
jgi:nitroreductase